MSTVPTIPTAKLVDSALQYGSAITELKANPIYVKWDETKEIYKQAIQNLNWGADLATLQGLKAASKKVKKGELSPEAFKETLLAAVDTAAGDIFKHLPKDEKVLIKVVKFFDETKDHATTDKDITSIIDTAREFSKLYADMKGVRCTLLKDTKTIPARPMPYFEEDGTNNFKPYFKKPFIKEAKAIAEALFAVKDKEERAKLLNDQAIEPLKSALAKTSLPEKTQKDVVEKFEKRVSNGLENLQKKK